MNGVSPFRSTVAAAADRVGTAASAAASVATRASELTPLPLFQIPPGSPLGLSAARALLAQAVAGTKTPQEALTEIANQIGLPVISGQKMLFIRIADSAPTSVAGDHTGWVPRAMQRHGPFEILEMSALGHGGYKFVQNGKFSADPYARSFRYDANGELSLCQGQGAHLERLVNLTPPGLPPRNIQLWVPRQKPTHHLYAFDGQNMFDPNAMHGGWQMQRAVGPSTLVVGIESTSARFDELTPFEDRVGGEFMGGHAPDLSDWLEKAVRPMIEKRFGSPKKSGVIGSSLGGLMAVYHVLRQRDRYDFSAGMSATMGWGQMGNPQGPSMFEFAEALTPGRETFYLDSGGSPAGGDNYAPVKKFAEQLSRQEFAWDHNLHHWHEPGAEHTEAAWRARLHHPLGIFESL